VIRYTSSSPHVIETDVSAPMEYVFDKDVGVFGGKWNREKSFTPRWYSPTVTEEYIGPVRKNTRVGTNHLGVAVISRGLDRGSKKTDWSQFVIIDYGYIIDDDYIRTGVPTKMGIQIKNGKYNAKLIFTKIAPMKTHVSFAEWGDGAGITDDGISHLDGVQKFADEVAKQFIKEVCGKDRRNLKHISNDMGTKTMLRGADAARVRKIAVNKMLGISK